MILKVLPSRFQKRSNKKIRPDELLKVNGIALIDNDNNLQFSGYGHTLSSCHMSFPSFDYLKSGLLGDDKAVMNYFRHFTAAEEFVMDDRSFEKWRKPMYSSIHVSKGCVAKCTFCQRGAKGYSTYELKDLEKHLEQLKKYDVIIDEMTRILVRIKNILMKLLNFFTNIICYGNVRGSDVRVLKKKI